MRTEPGFRCAGFRLQCDPVRPAPSVELHRRFNQQRPSRLRRGDGCRYRPSVSLIVSASEYPVAMATGSTQAHVRGGSDGRIPRRRRGATTDSGESGVGDPGPPEAVLGFLLNQLGVVIGERTARELAPLGMSPRTLGLLLALAEQPGASQTELGRRLRIDRTTMSQLVDDLTRAKLVSRTSLAYDRRSNQLALTAKGSKALQQGSARARKVEDAITEEMDPSRLSALKIALLELLERSDTP